MLVRIFSINSYVPISPSLCRPLSSLRSLRFSSQGSTSLQACWLSPRRAFSAMIDSSSDLFNYTSGRWIINDALRHEERKRIFNVHELCRLAAESVNRSPEDVVSFAKLAEGGFNRTFLVTMHDGFQMVARIPYPATVPKYFAVASEVATMDFLRSSGLPIPEVYGYSPVPDNAAETEYILMEYVQGIQLSHVWLDLKEQELVSVLRQLVQFESKMMSIPFPAGGSLYYAEDLKNVAGWPGIPLKNNERFCVGPDARLPMWFGRRSRLEIDRRPYESAEAALVGGAYKELAYLKQFGQPLLPFQRIRREAYHYQEQSPSDHVENLSRYLSIASSLVPSNLALRRFCIRHPDFQQNNVIVSKSSNSDWQIAGVFDWQHASILPLFLLSGVPERLQNYGDPISQSMTLPSLPENLDALDQTEQSRLKELHLRRLVHYHYVKHTEEHNGLHYAALIDPVGMLRRRLFSHASDPWEGETLGLKSALIEAMRNWEALSGSGRPCPVVFTADDVRKTMELEEVQRGADETLEVCQNMVGVQTEGWVGTRNYEGALVRNKQLKEDALAAAPSEQERLEIATHWPFDDMDESNYS